MLRCFSKQESHQAVKPACPDVIENIGTDRRNYWSFSFFCFVDGHEIVSKELSHQDTSSMCMQSICANEGCGKSEWWRTYGINAYREPYKLIMHTLLITCIDTCRDLVGLRQGEHAHSGVPSAWATALLATTLTIPSTDV